MSDERPDIDTEAAENQQQAPADAGEQEALRAELDAKAKKLDEVMRAYADLVNEREAVRQRLEREKDRQIESIRADLAASLLDTLEDLRLALQSPGGDARAVIQGVEMIATNVQRRAEGLGLTAIEAVGQRFDPNLHEAVDLVPVTDEAQDGMVVEEVRGGWLAGERVVRAARVRVGRHVAGQESGPNS